MPPRRRRLCPDVVVPQSTLLFLPSERSRAQRTQPCPTPLCPGLNAAAPSCPSLNAAAPLCRADPLCHDAADAALLDPFLLIRPNPFLVRPGSTRPGSVTIYCQLQCTDSASAPGAGLFSPFLFLLHKLLIWYLCCNGFWS